MALSPLWKKILVFGIGMLLLVVGVIGGIFWPSLSNSIKSSQLILSPDSTNFKMWRETPLPMFLDFFMFNWTNPEQSKSGKEKPHFQEIGPYVFREKHTRVNIKWHSHNNSVTFQQVREWHFVESDSVGSLNDTITNLNVISTVVAHSVKSQSSLIKRVVDYYLEGKESLWIKKSVGELTFQGYSDPLLDMAVALKNISSKIKIPFDKFGWFYSRNMSATYDGTFNMDTGAKDLNQLGIIQNWNNWTSTPFYAGDCGSVRATTGELYPPLHDSKSISVFASDLCSILVLNETDTVERQGIKGKKFRAEVDQFDNGTNYPEFSCYTDPEASMPGGVRNMSTCRDNAPAFVSFPHFYQADPIYRTNIDGMKPDPAKHEFFISLEPTTGIPLHVQAALQVNVWLEPVKGLKMFENVPAVMMPMFWFRQRTELTSDLASQVKVLVLLPAIGQYTLFSLAGLGSLLLLMGVIITLRRGWGKRDEDGPLLIGSSLDVR